MKILHLISQPPDFTGSGKFIQQVIAHAGDAGHDNALMAGVQGTYSLPDSLIPRARAVLTRFDGGDLPFPVAGMSDAMPYESTVFSRMAPEDLGRYKAVFREKISRALDRFKPDIIHSHHLWIMSALARSLAPELPMVTTCHGTCLRQHKFCPHISREISPALESINLIMALNPSQQEEIAARFNLPASRIPVMSGGYDDSVFRFSPKPDSGRVDIVYAGKLCRAKGVPWLLKSLERIKDLPFCLHVAGGGSGQEKQDCLELAEKLGEKAVYHGTLSHKDLADLMGGAHLFVLPSFFEGVPLVLLEALACGCRILTTDLPGVKEILSPPDDRLVHFLPLPPLETLDTPYKKDIPGLEEQLAGRLDKIIRQILASPEPDRRQAEEKTRPYTWSKVFERIGQVYDAALTLDK